MHGRRTFLKIAGAVCLARPHRTADAGRVVFCRVSRASLPEAIDWLRTVFNGAMPLAVAGPTLRYRSFVVGYEKSVEPELVICGTEATLVLDRRGWRRFA